MPAVAGTTAAARVRPLRNWFTLDALVVGVPVIALIALTFWIASRQFKPAPPDHLVMATGAPGGAYQRYGEKYRDSLARYGVTLELQGDARRRRKLRAPARWPGRRRIGPGRHRRAAAATSTESRPSCRWARSTTSRCGYSRLRRGPQVDKLADLAGSRMTIGAEGQRDEIARIASCCAKAAPSPRRTRFLPIGGEEALKALDAGEVDVVFQVAGIEAPIVRDLLRRRDLSR